MSMNYFDEKLLKTKYGRYGFVFDYACFLSMQPILDKRLVVEGKHRGVYLVRSRKNG